MPADETKVHLTLTQAEEPALSALLRRAGKWRLALRYMLGMDLRLETEDRRVLEQVIFPYYVDASLYRRVLFVGCDWYTNDYRRDFFDTADFWTLDPLPRVRRFAGRQHVVGLLEDLPRYFPENRFDLIICNGVFGFGLNARENCERAFAACHSRLREGGHLVLGWNDIPERRPLALDSLASLRAFRPFLFPPLGTAHFLTNTTYRHVYDFFQR